MTPTADTVPHSEINRRVAGLQRLLEAHDIGLAVIRQVADLYYYTGSVVDGFLAVAPQGDPVLLVRRPCNRTPGPEPPWMLAYYQDLREVPAILQRVGLGGEGAVGLELDVMPATLARRLETAIFPGRPCIDLSPLIRQQRMIKSEYEIEQIGQAAHILDEVLDLAPGFLQAGVTELEVSALLEYHLRRRGHQGLVRVRGWNLELFFGHVLSGLSGLEAAYTDTPSGGAGFSHAFPQGAGHKALAPGEPISIDLASCVHGYVADETRMYALGDLPEAAWKAFAVVERLYALFQQEARPGVSPRRVYELLLAEVEAHGLGECFMGLGRDRVAFLGHGVGLELDEFPLLTARFPYPLEADMVLAFEPKFFLPEIGMVGLEDTARITPQGVQWLTQSRRQVRVVPL